jgi:hypothetical protein
MVGKGDVGMFSGLWDIFFGCRHNNYSFPMSSKAPKQRPVVASETGTYVVCLDCGQEFAYDWSRMKVVSRLPAQAIALPSAVHSFAVK